MKNYDSHPIYPIPDPAPVSLGNSVESEENEGGTTMEDRLGSKEEFLRAILDSMLKSLDTIAVKATDEKTRDYATKVAKLNRETLAKMDGLPKAIESNE